MPLGLVALPVPFDPDPIPAPVVLSEPVPELPLLPGVEIPPVPDAGLDIVPGVLIVPPLDVPFGTP
jgi:hypothetical protein